VHFVAMQQGVEAREADVIERAISEACHNALFHGPANEDAPFFILEMTLENSFIKAVVKNRGKAFNFDDVKPFSIEQNFLNYRKGGLGIPIMKAVMDEVHYKRESDDLNIVTLVKRISVNAKRGDVERNED